MSDKNREVPQTVIFYYDWWSLSKMTTSNISNEFFDLIALFFKVIFNNRGVVSVEIAELNLGLDLFAKPWNWLNRLNQVIDEIIFPVAVQ